MIELNRMEVFKNETDVDPSFSRSQENDPISRRAAIDVVHKIIYGFFDLVDDDSEEPISDKDKLLLEVNKAICNGIKNLVSAQPESCKDAVSKEAVSSWLKQYGQDVLHGKYKFSLMYIWKNLMGLPSVTPKPEQRWIPCYPSELPKNMLLWATFDDGYGYRYVENVFWDMTEWNMDVSNVIAYMPYEEPEPYLEEGGE